MVPPGLETAFFATAGWVSLSVSMVAAPRTVCCTREAARSRFSPSRTASSVIASMIVNTKAGIEPAVPMKACTCSSVMSTATPALENRACSSACCSSETASPRMRPTAPSPTEMGVFGMARATAVPDGSASWICARVVPAARESTTAPSGRSSRSSATRARIW